MGNRGILFDSAIGDRPFNMALTNNYDATTNPSATNDFSQGYRKGSTWLNTSTGQAFMCTTDTVGAAVWQSTTAVTQGAAANHNAAVTLTAAELGGGLITGTPVAAIAFTLPLATAMDTGFPDSQAGTVVDFSVIDLATSADTITMTTNTGWTLVGSMVVTGGTSARFRATKTGTGAWTLFRLS